VTDWTLFGSSLKSGARGSSPDYIWLTEPDGLKVREMLEKWFAGYPEKHKERFRARFHSRAGFDAAFFELLLHEILVRMGFQVEVHPDIPESTKHPEFGASDASGTLYLEATGESGFSSEGRRDSRLIRDLLNQLNRILDPEEFLLTMGVRSVGAQPLSASEIRSSLREQAKANAGISTMGRRERARQPCTFRKRGWWLRFYPIGQVGREKVRRDAVLGAMRVQWGRGRRRLKNAISSKATRYGRLNAAFIIAVNAKEADHTDVVEALFGRSDDAGLLSPTRNTRVSGVLLFYDVRPWNLQTVNYYLYRNPWACHPIGSSTDGLNQIWTAGNTSRIKYGLKLGDILAP